MTADIDAAAAVEAVAETQPLVNCITNDVTVNDVANVTLHWGGLPVMSDDRADVVDMVAGAQALLLNMGTVSADGLDTMVAAGESAMDHDVPIVVDPVGVGATPARDDAAQRLVTDLDPAVVKGNYGEVTALAGEAAEVRGVESVGDYSDIAADAMAVAQSTDAVVIASGETDVVATADRAFEVSAGDDMMGAFVGTGCMLGATAGVFAGSMANTLEASLAGTLAFGRAGELAAAGEYGEYHGPSSYATTFLDSVAGLSSEDIPDSDTRISELGT